MRCPPSLSRSALVALTLIVAVVVPPMDERVDASSTQRGRPGFSVPTKDLLDPTPRPLGAISVIGDSVMLGSLTYSPNLVSRLADAGFGPIRARAGLGYGTGAFATAEWSRSSLWLQRWREEGWDAPTVLVNVGVNDSGLCRADRACSDRAIDHMMSTIGAGRDVIWPNITRSAVGSLDHQGTWNGALA
ncbi:MAG: SGNH/GDSL hydrolase family protein, partial [Ilumatobacteraceae bacterium]